MAIISGSRHRAAFTLIELLVVIAIIAILAAILFPVFAQAKSAALKTQDLSNFKQVGTASAIYLSDHDGRFFFSNRGGNNRGWGFGPPDAVPGVLLYPYVKSTKVFICPVDPNPSEEYRINEHAKDNRWTVSRLTPEQRLYALMVRSNMGFNYAFLAPWRSLPGNPTSAPVTEGEINDPSNTLAFANSIWDRAFGSGAPTGGGNWVIETPCWEDESNRLLRPLSTWGPASQGGDGTLYSYTGGWKGATTNIGSDAWLVYGGTWPFHNQVDLRNIQRGLKDGQIITMMADTSAKSRPLRDLVRGCQAFGTADRKGNRTDASLFMWDLD